MGAAWRAFAANWAPLVFAPVLIGLAMGTLLVVGVFGVVAVVGLPSGLERLLQQPPETWGPGIQRIVEGPFLYTVILVWAVVGTIIDAFFRGGLARMRIAAARGDAVRMGDMFSGGSCFASMLGLRFIIAAPSLLTTALGLAARVMEVPALIQVSRLLANLATLGIYIAMAFGMAFAELYVADSGQGPIDALRSAFSAPASDRGGVFGFLFVVGLVAIAGLCCCGLGGLVSLPYASVCVALLYTRLTNTIAPRGAV